MVNIKQSFRTGFSFGVTSGIITTLGLMVELHSGTHSKSAVIGGILVIAVADALSDALGIHISEESHQAHTSKETWEATISTFFSKFLVALTFIIPVLFFPLSAAIFVAIVWGLLLIGVLSFYIAKQKNERAQKVIFEHLLVAILVVIVSHYIGDLTTTLG